MRPHKLILENFGPFVGAGVGGSANVAGAVNGATVDFDRMGEFFLISGRTGSGKTTIFDGMMFALYGRTTGTRDERAVFSHYAQVGQIPSVSLEFTLAGTRYKVVRRPPHRRPKKKGGGMVDVPNQEAELFELTGDTWKPRTGKLSEVNSLIREKIRLTADEFSKIVLLPQGEFQKFLEEKTRDRAEVLEKLFPTSEHGDIASAFKEHARERRDELRRLEGDLKALAEKFDPAEFESTHGELSERKNGLDEAIAGLRAELVQRNLKLQSAVETGNRFARRKVLGERQAALHEKGRLVDQNRLRLENAGRAERARGALDARGVLRDDLRRVEKEAHERALELGKVREGLLEQAESIAKMPELERSLREQFALRESLRAGLENFRALRELFRGMEAKRTGLEKQSATLSGLDENYNKTTTVLEAIKVGPEDLDEKHRALDAVREKLRAEEIQETRALEFVSVSRGVEQRRERVETLEKELNEFRERLAVNEAAVVELEHRRDHAVAATLAAKLEENKPCSVCGSVEHPRPAELDEGTFGLEDRLKAAQGNLRDTADKVAAQSARLAEEQRLLDEAEKELVKYEGVPDAEQVRGGIETLSGSVDVLLAESREISENLKHREELREKTRTLEAQRTSARTALSGIEAELREMDGRALELKRSVGELQDPEAELARLDQAIGEKERYLAELRARRDELESRRSSLEGMQGELSHRLEELKGRLDEAHVRAEKDLAHAEFADEDTARAAMLREDEMNFLGDEIREHDNQVREIAIEIVELEKILGDAIPEDTENLAMAVKEAETALADKELEREEAAAELNRLAENEKTHRALSERRANLGRESAALVNLADELNGNNERKISFKNFVLGIYLEKVAARATRRLERMSDGRYSLLVTDIAYDGRTQTGLELDVFDANTGVRRNVRTLSGGEKFMASISLALGLADVIAERSGGIQLDAVFIDEGFGSLDDQALDGAISILDDIRGSRVVGIISHVNELKSRIPNRIEVEKGKNGSKIKHLV